jgi:hypothetical protein
MFSRNLSSLGRIGLSSTLSCLACQTNAIQVIVDHLRSHFFLKAFPTVNRVLIMGLPIRPNELGSKPAPAWWLGGRYCRRGASSGLSDCGGRLHTGNIRERSSRSHRSHQSNIRRAL